MAAFLTQEGITAWVIPLFFVLLVVLLTAVVVWMSRNQNRRLQQQLQQTQAHNNELRERAQYAEAQLQTLRATAMQERRNADEKLRLLQASEERLSQQFENLANKIFEQKSQGLQQQNQQTLSATLEPFKQQLESFKRQVQQQYSDETKERSALRSELMSLRELNRQMAHEAEALTRALKGDTKQQGNWGELVLERILEQSGLREGHEYQTQSHHRDEDGKSFKPDVIVHLPNQKDVVIDSKVSLSAYERYFNSDDEAEKERLLQEHVQSLKQHIKQLGKKNYQQLEGLRTLDYVLMFVPVEPAFLLAVDREPELIKLALEQQIMLVSPTNLLVALRTVHNIWQYEYQNRNAEKIAIDAGKLYDKFVGFIEDLEKVGSSLQTLDNRYQEAMKKLSSGRGNLVSRIEKFREMGVQTSKRIANEWLDDDDSDADSKSVPHDRK
ncbi:DNA recombination protein RmuC [Idiomarina sp. OT37-5b]|uniref:DNA recombination protein RmuC n=1 Tax=Idiomarina sp. OT37-5b TaxID=2100422 RepID=UPI0021CB1B29|nr:DNA recombination protein RmuC [Idiomarina sp. OT37-5b]